MDLGVYALLGTYFTVAGLLLLYGLNAYVMIGLFGRRRAEAAARAKAFLADYGDPMARDDLPVVTTQLPIYNEYNVARRAIEAAAAMDYPAGKHEIQVLDDSTDETRAIVDATAAALRAQGHDVTVIRRADRQGFKAGALAHASARARGAFFAIFDADFVPPRDFLLRSVPFFAGNPKAGLVQARWGHLNRETSLLTRAQSIGIDGHFIVEQSARTFNRLFMNFNGTAGLWRREAIEAAGGWSWDTLTEDMDLSYRMQLAGWETEYLPELVAPAEIPRDVNAFKSQQFRWAKGSIQTAVKLMPRVLSAPVSRFKRLQAWIHLTHYAVHPMMLLQALLAMPVLMAGKMTVGPAAFAIFGALLCAAMAAPNLLYIVSQCVAYPDWKRRILWMPLLPMIGVGMAVSNTRAVAEALLGVESGFVRTPKDGDRRVIRYRVRMPWVALIEIAMGVYSFISMRYYILQEEYWVGPFLAIYGSGFLFIGFLSLLHALGVEDRSWRSFFGGGQEAASVEPPAGDDAAALAGV